MKCTITTLAALFAFSSTAVAEDWAGISTIPYFNTDGGAYFIGELPESTQLSVPADRQQDPWLEPEYYDLVILGHPQVDVFPAQIVRATRDTASASAGINVPSSAFITANCASVVGLIDVPVAPGVTDLQSSKTVSGSCPAGIIWGQYQVPLSAFARSDTVSALASDVAALEQRILALEPTPLKIATLEADLQDARREADEGSAMAAAMTTVAPVDGKANRIGFNTATYNGTTALALSYSRAAGDVDFNVGVAMAGDNAMVKAGAGFSW